MQAWEEGWSGSGDGARGVEGASVAMKVAYHAVPDCLAARSAGREAHMPAQPPTTTRLVDFVGARHAADLSQLGFWIACSMKRFGFGRSNHLLLFARYGDQFRSETHDGGKGTPGGVRHIRIRRRQNPSSANLDRSAACRAGFRAQVRLCTHHLQTERRQLTEISYIGGGERRVATDRRCGDHAIRQRPPTPAV